MNPQSTAVKIKSVAILNKVDFDMTGCQPCGMGVGQFIIGKTGFACSTGCVTFNGGTILMPNQCNGSDFDIPNGFFTGNCVTICIGEDLHLSECGLYDTGFEFSGGTLAINDSIQIGSGTGQTATLTFNCGAQVLGVGREGA